MIPLHALLDRFKGVTNTEKGKKQTIINELKTRNIDISLKNITFSKNTIVIHAAPIIKTEIMFIKQDILEKLKQKPETRLFSDIK